MRNLRIDLCYDGTRYRGWQKLSASEQTIQGKLEATLSRILDEPVEVAGSGRTDAGVHALGQVANFHCQNPMPCDQLLARLRQYLPEDIGIYSVRDVSGRFHARLNAKQKTYRYRLWYSERPCVFERKYVTVKECRLDIAKMREAALLLIGTHDFSAFCGNKHFKKSTQRHISRIDIHDDGDVLTFTITGNGFLQHMIRILVGTLVEVGEGSRTPNTVGQLFGAARAEAGCLMPPSGLCLMEVIY